MDAMASDCVPSGIGNGFRTKAILKIAIATPVKEWRQIAPALLQLIAFLTAIRLAEVWFRHHSLAASVLPIVDGASVSFVATLLAVHSHRFILLQKPYPSKFALWHSSMCRETKFFLYGTAVWLIGWSFYMTAVLAGWFIGGALRRHIKKRQYCVGSFRHRMPDPDMPIYRRAAYVSLSVARYRRRDIEGPDG